MKTKKQIVVNAVEGWIVESELPNNRAIKALRPNHPNHGLTEDEIEERSEFIAWRLRQETALLDIIPTPESDHGFFIADLEVTDTEYSAFNTHDYQRMKSRPNWAVIAKQKLIDRVQELALLHSCLSTEAGRTNTKERFKKFLEDEFQDKLEKLAQRLHRTKGSEGQSEIKCKIGQIQRQILELYQVWAKHAQAP